MTKKKFLVLLIAEALILLLCAIGLFHKRESLEMDASFFKGTSGIYDEKKGGWYIDPDCGSQTGTFLVSAPLSLPAGVYRISLLYETDTNMQNRCTARDPFTSLEGVLTNGDHLDWTAPTMKFGSLTETVPFRLRYPIRAADTCL